MDNSFYPFLFFVTGSNILAIVMRNQFRKRQPKKLVCVGRVEDVVVYPIKSCPGINVDEAYCLPVGLQIEGIIKDRHFVVVTENEKGEACQVLTQRQIPRMALVKVTLVNEPDNKTHTLRLSAPDMPNLDINLPLEHQITSGTHDTVIARLWGETIYGRDCGPNAATWWSIFLGRENVRLMHSEIDSHLKSVSASEDSPEFVKQRVASGDKTAYADWAPLLIATTASIADLNSKIAESPNENAGTKPITYKNFRPNILIKTAQPFDEDNFDRLYIGSESIADGLQLPETDGWQPFKLSEQQSRRVVDEAAVVIRNVKPCTRCVLTTVDPSLGERRPDGQPLKLLKEFRLDKAYGKSPLFGINMVPDRTGKLRKGDLVFASYLAK